MEEEKSSKHILASFRAQNSFIGTSQHIRSGMGICALRDTVTRMGFDLWLLQQAFWGGQVGGKRVMWGFMNPGLAPCILRRLYQLLSAVMQQQDCLLYVYEHVPTLGFMLGGLGIFTGGGLEIR